jgi:hypothetical protein
VDHNNARCEWRCGPVVASYDPDGSSGWWFIASERTLDWGQGRTLCAALRAFAATVWHRALLWHERERG